MLNLSEKIYARKFRGTNTKEAYLKACRWLAINVISKDELNRNITYNFQKVDNDPTQLPTIELKIQITIDESIAKERHCEICRETHSSFFINEHYNCNECKLSAYHKRCNHLINQKKLYVKELLERSMEEHEE